ncbi:PREDICTED: RING finger protein 11-like [Rhagoletis zephyria]|uniref:RING finger protein 11-like n=1 Tax=Rhagoletis zephyria TaxID=28612 RepID=UPI0008119440|nr:PREDICTED: RING finger protein 11-like [Rhagoletis zephyria]KAH9398444.1 RING finger protein 11 [Tyrophagus putrescentiae]
MGNCLKAAGDDISLLRESAPTARESSDQFVSQAGLQLGTRNSQDNGTNPTLFYPSPNVSRQANQLTEEEQVKIAQRIGLIQHLPTGSYDGCKKNRECVICMIEFSIDDPIRFLPCMHIYHTKCIDDWLMRSFTCPSCMEPVDSALLCTYQTD